MYIANKKSCLILCNGSGDWPMQIKRNTNGEVHIISGARDRIHQGAKNVANHRISPVSNSIYEQNVSQLSAKLQGCPVITNNTQVGWARFHL